MRQISGVRLTEELNKHTSSKEVAKDNGYCIPNYRELVEQVAKLSYLNKDYLLFLEGKQMTIKIK